LLQPKHRWQRHGHRRLFTDESTAERTATYLRRGRLRQNQENNRRYKGDCRSVNHSFSPIIHEHQKQTVGRA
jgi:hypothetical protein